MSPKIFNLFTGLPVITSKPETDNRIFVAVAVEDIGGREVEIDLVIAESPESLGDQLSCKFNADCSQEIRRPLSGNNFGSVMEPKGTYYLKPISLPHFILIEKFIQGSRGVEGGGGIMRERG